MFKNIDRVSIPGRPLSAASRKEIEAAAWI
jgi:hypothetical protein